MSREKKIARSVCEGEFERFADAMGLDLDQSQMDDEDKKGLLLQKNRILSAMEFGALVINEKGEPVYTPQEGSGEPITFHEPRGASFMAMDQKKAGHDNTKAFAFLADMTQQSVQRFAGMAGRDLKVCQAVFLLFLA